MICTLPMNERLAYLAGIFDGEGCVGLWNQKPKGKAPSATLQLRINMITPFAVQLLYETFGGALFANKPRAGKRLGKPFAGSKHQCVGARTADELHRRRQTLLRRPAR